MSAVLDYPNEPNICFEERKCIKPDNSGPWATVATSVYRHKILADGVVTNKDFVIAEAKEQGLLNGMSLMGKSVESVDLQAMHIDIKTTVYQN